ncbi:MAG: hypothetical protein ACYC69_02765 [Thermodesulfovibrionales bacterium]
MAKSIVVSRGSEMVKTGVGFAWFGFLFTFLWLMTKGLWKHAAITFVVLLGSALLFKHEAAVVSIVTGLVIGFNGWKWHLQKLSSEGFSAAVNTP